MNFFISSKEYKLFNNINEELINKLINVKIELIQIDREKTVDNIYGEAYKKIYKNPKKINALIEISQYQQNINEAGYTNEQSMIFYFLNKTLKELNIYPTIGDIIRYNGVYYEISSINDMQLIATVPDYNLSLACKAIYINIGNISFANNYLIK